MGVHVSARKRLSRARYSFGLAPAHGVSRSGVALSLSINVSGVYISYPFCAQKCTYCNFASGVFPRELEVRYREALARETRAHAWDWTPDTVYLGGGTPSHLPPADLRALLAG